MSTVNTTTRLLDAAHDIWEGYHTHPFVRGIADGSLAAEKFCFYLLQDYLYLFDYARVFAMGVVKAREPNVMRAFARYVHQILDGEMDIHRSYMERLNISREKAEHAQASIDNLSYTAYMRAVAQEEGVAEIAVAILSCAVSYEHIAQRIVRENPAAASHPFYGEWVSGYASEQYATENHALSALVDRLTEDYSERQLVRLEEIFVNCSRYEALFWDMAWEMRM